MQACDGLSAHPQLDAFGAHQRLDLVCGEASFGVLRDDSAARIVAVKSIARAGVKLGLVPRAKNQVEFGADFGVRRDARICRIVTGNLKGEMIGPQACHGAEFISPLSFIFRINAQASLDDVVSPRGGQHLARDRVLQCVGNVVGLELQTQRVLHTAGAQLGGPSAAGVQTQGGAPVGLGELVTIDRVVQKIREVGKQVQPVSDDIRIDLGGCAAGRRVGGLSPRARQAVAAGLAAIGLVDRVKPAQQTRVYRALGDLVGGVPFGFIGHQRDVQAIGLGALAVAQNGVALTVVVTHRKGAIIFE